MLENVFYFVRKHCEKKNRGKANHLYIITSTARVVLVLRFYRVKKLRAQRTRNFTFSYACAYSCVCPASSENEIPLRHNTSTKIFTTRGHV